MSISHDWRSSKRRSPIVRSFRFLLRMPNMIDTTLAEADLPEPCAALIRTVVRRTRLWRSEKLDLAHELIDHVRDALAAEQTPEHIVKQFGDPITAAKLIRRARKRQRHPLLKLWTASVKLAIASPLVLLGVYALLWIRLYADSPTVKVDYLARYQPPPSAHSATPGHRPPYELYQLLDLRWRDATLPIDERAHEQLAGTKWSRSPSSDISTLPRAHPMFDELVDIIRSLQPDLERVAEAAAEPHHNTPLGFDIEYSDNYLDASIDPEDRLFHIAPITQRLEDRPTLVGVLLPHLGVIRGCARLLEFDARLAAKDSDSDRFMRRINAMLDLSHQAARDRFVISQLVAQAVHALACQSVDRSLRQHPRLLDSAAISELAHAIAASAENVTRVSYDLEMSMIDDVLQRTFTDDGSGNGRITNEALTTLFELTNDDFGYAPNDDYAVTGERVIAPLAAMLVADRTRQRAICSQYLARSQAVINAGPAAMPDALVTQNQLESLLSSLTGRIRYIIPSRYLGDLSRVADNTFRTQARSDATLTALAAELFTRHNGRLPTAIEELTPRFLPSLPEDPFAPGTALRITTDDDTITIYSVGQNATDNGGMPLLESDGDPASHSLRTRWSDAEQSQEGDWVLFPPAD